MQKMNRNIASVSWGKDSTAMLLYLIEKNMPLDEVVSFDTGMEFQAIYNVRDKILPLLAEKGIKYTELKPDRTFDYMMFDVPHKGKKDGIVRYGYGWCGGFCRWGTQEKQRTMNEYTESADSVYVGIAYDEPKRIEKLEGTNKVSPLYINKMTEPDCLKYCYDRGIRWLEPTTRTESGYIDLYQILDRVSCWCCANKNAWELWNVWKYLPQYWEQLKELQSKIDRPMKNFCNKKYGEYGNVFELEKVFESGYIPKHRRKSQ